MLSGVNAPPIFKEWIDTERMNVDPYESRYDHTRRNQLIL